MTETCVKPNCLRTPTEGSDRCVYHANWSPNAETNGAVPLSRTSGWAGFIGVLAVLVGAGSVIGGALLAMHSVGTDCSYGICSGSSHPFRHVGIAVIITGSVQALFIGSFAALHQEVRSLRIALLER